LPEEGSAGTAPRRTSLGYCVDHWGDVLDKAIASAWRHGVRVYAPNDDGQDPCSHVEQDGNGDWKQCGGAAYLALAWWPATRGDGIQGYQVPKSTRGLIQTPRKETVWDESGV